MLSVINEIVTFLGFPFRKKRHEFFKELFLKGKGKIKMLDVGGTQEYWKTLNFSSKNCSVTIINLSKVQVRLPNFKSIVGDALYMKRFSNKEFDIVFSNSVIEHVGDWEDQKIMANEVQRVGKHYFVQTPNYYFPIEPHLLFPFFQFLPLKFKIFIYRHVYSTNLSKSASYKTSLSEVSSIRLLKKKELSALFRGGTLVEEKFLGLTKSFIVYK